MVQLLYKYLIINKEVALPGVGIFYINRQPARHDYANQVFTSPALNINFNASTAIPDKKFYEFMSKEKGMDEAEAVRNLYAFANRLNQEVKADKTVELPGMGILKKSATGQLSFQPANVLNTYFPPTVAGISLTERANGNDTVAIPLSTEIETENVSEVVLTEAKGNRYWWIYAIILTLIGVAAIAYYYYLNGSLR